jgi:hypothetical protein
MMFGQGTDKLGDWGRGRFGPMLFFALDQCDALAMHRGSCKN